MEIARHWRLRQTRYGLIGERNEKTGEIAFPPRNRKGWTPHALSGMGEVYSFSTVYDAPAGFEGNAPYTIALIKLQEGPLVTAQLTDVANNQVYIGMPVEMVTRKMREDGDRGMLIYSYKFRPVEFESRKRQLVAVEVARAR